MKKLFFLGIVFSLLFAAAASAGTYEVLDQSGLDTGLRLTTEIVCGFDSVPKCEHVEFKKMIKLCNEGESTVTGITFKDTFPAELTDTGTQPVFDATGYRATKGMILFEPLGAGGTGATKIYWGASPDPKTNGFSLAPGECATVYLWLETREKPNNENCPYFWSSTGTHYLDTSLTLGWDVLGGRGSWEQGNDEYTAVTVTEEGSADWSCGCEELKPLVAFVGDVELTNAAQGGHYVTFHYKSAHPLHDPENGHVELLDNFAYIGKPELPWQTPAVYVSLAEEPTCGTYDPGYGTLLEWFDACTSTNEVTFHTFFDPPFNILDIKLDECMNAADPAGEHPECEENCDVIEVPNGDQVPEFSTLGVLVVLIAIAVLYPVMRTKVSGKKNN
ncbi:hypothetical protein KY316_00075 [Candidatus Woesearchaeota archaeon]|nr:hypothetical protein [Candidatus Woesearchaeota archaeon]